MTDDENAFFCEYAFCPGLRGRLIVRGRLAVAAGRDISLKECT